MSLHLAPESTRPAGIGEGRPAARVGPAAAARSVGAHALLLALWFLASLLLAFILAPLIGLAVMQPAGNLVRVAGMADIWQAIGLSLAGALLAAAFAGAFGVPLAYVLARGRFRGRDVLAAIVDLPLAVPHTVAGIALLFVFGRQGFIGGPAGELVVLRFWGTLAGIVAAMLFVSAPYTVNAARIGFETVDPRLEQVARTLGLGPWRVFARVSLPLARRGIVTGLTLTFARAISEFAAVAILSYYPMTAPVKIYELFLQSGLDDAAGAALLLLIVSLGLFVLFRQLGRGASIGIGR